MHQRIDSQASISCQGPLVDWMHDQCGQCSLCKIETGIEGIVYKVD